VDKNGDNSRGGDLDQGGGKRRERFSNVQPNGRYRNINAYGCVLSFVSGLLTRYWTDFMCTPKGTRRWLCVEGVASRGIINSLRRTNVQAHWWFALDLATRIASAFDGLLE